VRQTRATRCMVLDHSDVCPIDTERDQIDAIA
jgi:hypothetical protein